MNLYILTNTNPIEFDTYNSVVVAAESVAAARKTSVSNRSREWCDKPKVKLIGVATKGTKPGVIHVNFRNG